MAGAAREGRVDPRLLGPFEQGQVVGGVPVGGDAGWGEASGLAPTPPASGIARRPATAARRLGNGGMLHLRFQSAPCLPRRCGLPNTPAGIYRPAVRAYARVIRLAFPPAAVVLIEVETSSSSQSS